MRSTNRVATPLNTAPTPPADTPPEVCAEFARLVGLMGDRVRPEDQHLLLILATSWTTWRRAQLEVARLGNVVMSGGTAIANPSLSVANQAYAQILALSKELGVTPMARAKRDPYGDDDE